MSRVRARLNGMRAEIAAAAARIMVEGGIDDYANAKRKAARQIGAPVGEALPGNDEIESALREYLAVYQTDSHPAHVITLRQSALLVMRELKHFNPYLTGPVLRGLAGPYTGIDLMLFPDSAKEVEIYLLDRNLAFTSSDARRYSGDRARSASVLDVDWNGMPVSLSVFDARDERVTLKTSQAGKVIDRATISEVVTLLGRDGG